MKSNVNLMLIFVWVGLGATAPVRWVIQRVYPTEMSIALLFTSPVWEDGTPLYFPRLLERDIIRMRVIAMLEGRISLSLEEKKDLLIQMRRFIAAARAERERVHRPVQP